MKKYLLLSAMMLSLAMPGVPAAEPAIPAAQPEIASPMKIPVITWDEKTIYVDGAPFFIRGINYTFSDIPKEKIVEQLNIDVPILKDLNVNTVRVFSELPREALDILYQNGIMVIMEIHNYKAFPGPWTTFTSKEGLEEAIMAATEQVKRCKDHPAMLMWCAWNDGPFGTKTVESYTREEIESYLRGIVDAVKKEDPAHPVTCANMPGCKYDDLGASFVDVIGFNNYAGLHSSGDYTHKVTLTVFDKLAEFGKKYKKPIIITETGYSSVSRPEIQGSVVKSLIDAARTRTAGICVFMFADDWTKAGNPPVQDNHIEEYWGIVKKDRSPKSGYEALKNAYAEIAKNGPEKANIEPYVVPGIPNPSGVETHRKIEDFEFKTLSKGKLSGIYTGSSTVAAEISKEKCWAGKRSLKITYKPSAINTWGCAVINFDKPLPKNAKGLSMWIYRDGSQNSVVVQVQDKDRDVWKDYAMQLGERGWAYYVIDFGQVKRDPNGSSPTSNNVFDDGTICKFIIVFNNVASEISSTVYIDDMRVLY